jgi:hypothetical protein
LLIDPTGSVSRRRSSCLKKLRISKDQVKFKKRTRMIFVDV